MVEASLVDARPEVVKQPQDQQPVNQIAKLRASAPHRRVVQRRVHVVPKRHCTPAVVVTRVQRSTEPATVAEAEAIHNALALVLAHALLVKRAA